MSIKDVYEHIIGEYQDLSKIKLNATPIDTKTSFDYRKVNIAGKNIDLFSDEAGTTRLILGTDYNLAFKDEEVSLLEAEDIYSGYEIINATYADIELYLDIRCVGGYTKYTGGKYERITSSATITPPSFGYIVFVETSTASIITTLEDGSRVGDEITIAASGPETVEVIGTGLSQQVFSNGAKIYLWNGTKWIIPGGDDKTAEGTELLGTITWWPSLTTAEPSGHLFLNGSLKSITAYPDLYDLLGTAYGGDGVTTFGLPKMNGLVFEDASDGSIKVNPDGIWMIKSTKLEFDTEILDPITGSHEMPTYGDKLIEGELFLDGDKTLVSSYGRKPYEENVEYIPAVKRIDGINYIPSEIKWNQRGVYGLFPDYENVAATEPSAMNATVKTEGGWEKILSTSNEGQVDITLSSALTNNGIVSCFAKKGNSTSSKIIVSNGPVIGECVINWSSGTFSFNSGAIDKGSVFYSNEICFVAFEPGSTGGVALSLTTGPSTDDYTYYKDWMAVDFDFTVPYTKGFHIANKLQYPFDWATSSEWTIEGWFKIAKSLPSNNILFDMHTTENGLYISNDHTTNNIFVTIKNGGTSSTLVNSVVIPDEYFYLKLIISNSKISLTINSTLIDTTSNIPSLSNYPKYLIFSNLYSMRGYLADFRVFKGEDLTTDHYTLNKPWYNPNKTYGKNASWSISDKGDMSSETIEEIKKDIPEIIISSSPPDNAQGKEGAFWYQY